MGAKTSNITAPKLDSIQIQQSAKNVTITQGWGTVRTSCNMLWVNGFTAVAHTEEQGGKGGKLKQTTFSYTADLILGIMKGPIEGIRTVYRDKSVFTDGATTALAQAGLSLATGEIGQAVWPYLESTYPAEAIGYSGIAYVYAPAYDLGDSGGFGNHSFEVVTQVRQEVSGDFLDDANPGNVVDDFFNNEFNGVPFWRPGLLGDLTDYSDYCLASGLLLSPLLDTQTQGSAFLEELFESSNGDCLWSEGLLKVKPLGDTEVTGNGITWTPDLTPLYDLTIDDFQFDDGDDPVRQIIKRPADAFNWVQVAYLDRANQYSEDVMPAQDQANIEAYGLRKEDPKSLHMICDKTVARLVAQLRLQRKCYVRRKFKFKLDWRYQLLEPLDLVTITIATAQLTLFRQLVRITKFDESDGGDEYDVEAEEMLVGTADAPAYGVPVVAPFTPNYDVSPGPVEPPIIFNPPAVLTPNGQETWCAVAGLDSNWGGCFVWTSLDDTSYQMVGTVQGRARFGVITTSLPVSADPDETSVLGVDLSASLGSLAEASEADADASVTMFLLGSELLAYANADLIDPNQYALSYLRRGVLGTAQASYAIDDTFVRLDDAIFKLPYLTTQSGQLVYVKFQSFNIYGQAAEALEDCTAYTVTPNTVIAPAPAAPAWTLTGTTFVEGDDAIPAIVVEGACDNADATGMQFYIRVNGTSAWAASGGYIARGATKIEITNSLTSGTNYDVGLTYLVGGVEGDMLVIGTATAGVRSSPTGGPADGTVLLERDATGSFTFTIPPGVNFVDIETWGPGGYSAGASSGGTEKEPTYDPLAGGGAGGYGKKHISTSSGDVIAGVVGAGGSGTATSISSPFTMTANAGGNASGPSTPGTGGSCSGGDTNTTGHAGGLTNTWDGGGSAPAFVDQTTAFGDGTVPGGGAPGGFAGPAGGRVRITARTS